MANSQTYGGVSDAEIRSIAEDLVIPPTEAGASVEIRFVRNICRLVHVRITKGEPDQYSLFLLKGAQFAPSQAIDGVENPLLAHGKDQISGHIWYAPSTLATAHSIDLSWSDCASLFEVVRQAGLGDIPAVLIDWRENMPMGRLYRGGVNQPEEVDQVFFEDSPISTGQMKNALDDFYEKSLRTPSIVVEGHAQKVWQDAAKGIPAHRPEEVIQGRLLESLKGRFSGRDMRAEEITEEGRADITVHSKSSTAGGRPARVTEWILELKALCDMTSNGGKKGNSHISAAVSDGLEQVVAYREKLSGEKAALCCYDMQKEDVGDKDFYVHIESDAACRHVELWRWYLYRSTPNARKAKGYVKSCSK